MIRGDARGPGGDESGLTIVETMFSVALLAVAFLGLAEVQAFSSRGLSLGRNHEIATMLATEQIEDVRRSSFTSVVSGSSTRTTGGVRFTVSRTVTAIGTSNKRVDVVSTWTDRFGARSIRLASLLTRASNP